jgi:hypothetical protein
MTDPTLPPPVYPDPVPVAKPYYEQPQLTPPPVLRSRMTPGSLHLVAVISAACIILGATVLPWVSVTMVFGNIKINGIDTDDGKVIAVIGVLALLTTIAKRGWLYVSALLGLGTGVLGIYEMVNFQHVMSDADSEYAIISMGLGLYVLTIAGFVLFLTAIALVNGNRKR